ncbi:MAG TPA: hypothetical protein PLG20_04605 [Candidatus Syntrophosphaera sp.]|nr:hypothetical protein [Candidatus Syntrophosphaera sp.]
MPVVVDLHLLDGETIVSPYNCNFAIGIFPALITLDDHDILMLDLQTRTALQIKVT